MSSQRKGQPIADVRVALRHELAARGFGVAEDTVSSRGELYVEGNGDLAAALFEFKGSVEEAIETMYQGHWTQGLPPRFAVLPASAASDSSFELLDQMRIVPVLYEVSDEHATFVGLDDALQRLRD
jgi:hypothetical protein